MLKGDDQEWNVTGLPNHRLRLTLNQNSIFTITKANTHQTFSFILAHIPFAVTTKIGIVASAIAFYLIHFLLNYKTVVLIFRCNNSTQLIPFKYSLPFDTVHHRILIATNKFHNSCEQWTVFYTFFLLNIFYRPRNEFLMQKLFTISLMIDYSTLSTIINFSYGFSMDCRVDYARWLHSTVIIKTSAASTLHTVK